MRRVLPLLGLVLAVAACGSSSHSLFTLQKTQACMVDKGAKPARGLDFIASTATGGAFKVRIGKNTVTVVLGETEGDARQIELAYTRAAAKNVGVGDVLARRRNVVTLWHEHPTDEQLAVVADCLK